MSDDKPKPVEGKSSVAFVPFGACTCCRQYQGYLAYHTDSCKINALRERIEALEAQAKASLGLAPQATECVAPAPIAEDYSLNNKLALALWVEKNLKANLKAAGEREAALLEERATLRAKLAAAEAACGSLRAHNDRLRAYNDDGKGT